jgi:hypothetical protein
MELLKVKQVGLGRFWILFKMEKKLKIKIITTKINNKIKIRKIKTNQKQINNHKTKINHKNLTILKIN